MAKPLYLSVSWDKITLKNLFHASNTYIMDEEKHVVGQNLNFCHGVHRRIPHCIPQCWHVGESTPFCRWFMNGYRSRCGSVDAGSLKGGRRLCIKGRSWKVQHRGRLDIFTSIALSGRHFKGTSSLKTRAWTFMCSRIYTLPCLCFMWFGSWRVVAARREQFCSLHKRTWACCWFVLWVSLKVFFFCVCVIVFRCGFRIVEPNGERGSVLARCSRFGHTSLLPTSSLYWPGLKTMHRYISQSYVGLRLILIYKHRFKVAFVQVQLFPSHVCFCSTLILGELKDLAF